MKPPTIEPLGVTKRTKLLRRQLNRARATAQAVGLVSIVGEVDEALRTLDMNEKGYYPCGCDDPEGDSGNTCRNCGGRIKA